MGMLLQVLIVETSLQSQTIHSGDTITSKIAEHVFCIRVIYTCYFRLVLEYSVFFTMTVAAARKPRNPTKSVKVNTPKGS